MKASEFFADRAPGLLLRAVFAAGTAVFLLLTGTKPGIVVILGIIWFLVFVIGQAVDFFRCRSDCGSFMRLWMDSIKNICLPSVYGQGGQFMSVDCLICSAGREGR